MNTLYGFSSQSSAPNMMVYCKANLTNFCCQKFTFACNGVCSCWESQQLLQCTCLAENCTFSTRSAACLHYICSTFGKLLIRHTS